MTNENDWARADMNPDDPQSQGFTAGQGFTPGPDGKPIRVPLRADGTVNTDAMTGLVRHCTWAECPGIEVSTAILEAEHGYHHAICRAAMNAPFTQAEAEAARTALAVRESQILALAQTMDSNGMWTVAKTVVRRLLRLPRRIEVEEEQA